jgi:N-acetylneuraminate synthase
MNTELQIDGRRIGRDHLPYVIAEISANHRGSKQAAVELIEAAAEAGADAVKLQHYTPETITMRSTHPDFRVGGGTLWDGRQLFDLYEEAMTPWEWTDDLVAAARKAGITWFSSPFDPTAIEFLAELDMAAYKIASFEIVDLPLIRAAAQHGKPLIISTGMATLSEIDAAVVTARGAGATSIGILRCNSGYPASAAEMDLRTIPVMADLWGLPVGLSDHTLGVAAAIAAVALGACIIEKHITFDRSEGGPDSAFSSEPGEFALLVSAVREAHSALGSVRFGPSEREVASRKFRRSLRAQQAILAGEVITTENVRSMRPAGGLAPDELDRIVGAIAVHDIEPGDPILWGDFRSADGLHA